MVLEKPSSLPEFEAFLKSESFYGIDKKILQKLQDESLRRVKSTGDIQWTGSLHWNNTDFIFTDVLKKIGLFSFADDIKKNSKSNSSVDGHGYCYNSTEYIKNYSPKLFTIKSILIRGDEIIIVGTEKGDSNKPFSVSVDPQVFLNEGLKSLKINNIEYEKLPKTAIFGPKDYELKLGEYSLKQIKNDTLTINKKGSVEQSMESIGFDTLPVKSKIVDKQVIANFKPDYVEFYAVSDESENGAKQIRLTPYMHRDITYVDFSKYGKCIAGTLDPNKNFIIGLFEIGNKKTLNILRVSGKAELMAKFDNIDELLFSHSQVY